MRIDVALSRIRQAGTPVLRTADVMAILKIRKDHASQIMSRLSRSGHVTRLKRGVWLTADHCDPFALVEYLTAPFPAYISLQSALYHHGMISQIPASVYCVSPARTRVYKTPVGDFSIHHIDETLFFGFDETGKTNIKIATPEKALIDFFYLSCSKTRLFTALPEIELPENFDKQIINDALSRISKPQRRSVVSRKINALLKEA